MLLDPATSQVLASPQLEAVLDTRADWPPHLVLFVVFLKLFRNLQGDLNQLPEKHLRHYYENGLGLQRRAAASDDVHVIFELAKNAPPTLVPAGTLLDAGNDEKGRPLTYGTQTEVVVSAAAVGGVRRLVMERDRRFNRRFFVADGFTELEAPGGFTFGRRQLDQDPTQRFMSEAPLGFGVAAPILGLAEGDRTITLLAHLIVPPSAPPVVSQAIGYALDVTVTGPEGWLVPNAVQASLLEDDGSGQPALSVTAKLGAATAAIVAFDPALHGPGPSIGRPLVRCLVKGDTGIYEVLDALVVERIELSVDVKGVRNLVVQSADGPLTVNQPMPLFGSQPQLGATLYIGSAEVFSKRLTSLDLHLEWKSPPPDLFDHYRGYFDSVDSFLSDKFHTLFRSRRRYSVRPLVPDPAGEPDPVRADHDRSADDLGRSPARSTRHSLAASIGSSRIWNSRMRSMPAANTASCASCSSNRPGAISPRTPRVPFEAFGHSAFPRRYANQAIALSKTNAAAEYRCCQTSRTRRCSTRCRSTTPRRRSSFRATGMRPERS